MTFNFNINDLDSDLLKEQIEKNVESIYSSPAARKGRSKSEIRYAVGIGIPCEVAMIQFHGCVNYDHKYGDVTDPNGKHIECKASTYSWTSHKINEMCGKIYTYTPAHIVMFWHKQGDEYIFERAVKLKD